MLLTEVYANGYTYYYTYNNLERVTEITMTDSDGRNYDMYRHEYENDVSLAEEYNIREDLGRGTIEIRYIYDLSGRLAYTRTGDGESYRYSYDAIRNPLSYRGMTFSWKRARELSSITKNGQTYSYRYNKDGLRINKYLTDGTVSYQYDGSLLVGEQKKDSNGNLVYELEFIYDSTGSVIVLLYNGTEYYYEKNLQGDIVGILNSQGERIVTYQYDSWGKLTGSTGDSQLKELNPLRYRGYYYDEETGLYYLNSRYYDAEVGRFISADSFISNSNGFLQGYNLFTYCCNNPSGLKDSEGTWPEWADTVAKITTAAVIALGTTLVIAGTGGMAAAIILGVGYSAATGGYFNELNGGSYTSGCIGGAISGLIFDKIVI